MRTCSKCSEISRFGLQTCYLWLGQMIQTRGRRKKGGHISACIFISGITLFVICTVAINMYNGSAGTPAAVSLSDAHPAYVQLLGAVVW